MTQHVTKCSFFLCLFLFFYIAADGFLKKHRSSRDSRNFNNKSSLNFNRYEAKHSHKASNMLFGYKPLLKKYFSFSVDSSED